MGKGESVASRVEHVLGAMQPVTPVHLHRLYDLCTHSPDERAAVRSALYQKVANTPVSRRSIPRKYFGIKLDITPDDDIDDPIVLSLPGVPAESLAHDRKDSPRVEEIKERAAKSLGAEAVRYWLVSAQARSVDIASKAMLAAKRRDKTCRICAELDAANSDAGSAPVEQKRISACHVLSRKVAFWLAVDSLLDEGCNPLTDEGALRLQAALRDDVYHSHEDFIVGLCHEHDRLLVAGLVQAVSDGKGS